MTVSRGLESFEQSLAGNLAWRRKELTTLRMRVNGASDKLLPMYLRSGFSLLYAHWEGYVKFAVERYVQFVDRQGKKLSELSLCFVSLALGQRLSQAAESKKPKYRLGVVSALWGGSEDVFKIQAKYLPGAQSNLNWERFADMLDAVGVDSSQFALRAKMIDDILLKYRNKIAHGESFCPSVDEFNSAYDGVMSILDRVRDELADAAIQGKYRRSAQLSV